METQEEIKKVKEIIEELMTKDERCRNDDKWLTYLVMRKFTNIYIPFEDFQKIPAFATIQKVRQFIQNKEGRLQPTDPCVFYKRQKRQM